MNVVQNIELSIFAVGINGYPKSITETLDLMKRLATTHSRISVLEARQRILSVTLPMPLRLAGGKAYDGHPKLPAE